MHPRYPSAAATKLRAMATSELVKPAGRTHALRCRVTAREDGWHARPTGPQGSHVLSSMLAADALAIVPSAVTDVSDGARVRIEALRELGGVSA